VRRIRVLILINSLGPYGAETFVLNHVRNADRSRFEMHVCQIGGSEALAPAIREAGVEVHNLRARRRVAPVAFLRLAALLRRLEIDVLQTHVGYAGVVGRVVGRAARVPVIVSTEQTVSDDSDFPPALRAAIRATFRLAHGHVFISQAVRESFAGWSPERAGPTAPVISNGIDGRAIAAAVDGRAAVRKELGLENGALAFVNVARLQPRKGQRFAIEALAKVRARAPGASLWLIGGGPDEPELRALAERHGVAGAVTFLGQRLDVHRLLGGFDAYVHPALIEGLGISVLEAMAAGLPTVATSVGGIPEYVHDGDTGWLVPPADGDALAERMLAVVTDPDERRRRAGRGQALIMAEHDIRASVAAYEALYSSLSAAATGDGGRSPRPRR